MKVIASQTAPSCRRVTRLALPATFIESSPEFHEPGVLMSEAVEAFYAGCVRVLQGDAALIAQLQAQGFACEEGYWAFSLPAVQAWLEGAGTDCQGWLKRLYASDFNARLKALGGEVVIAENRGKVDESLYCLRRLL
jgi:hypothetical protein